MGRGIGVFWGQEIGGGLVVVKGWGGRGTRSLCLSVCLSVLVLFLFFYFILFLVLRGMRWMVSAGRFGHIHTLIIKLRRIFIFSFGMFTAHFHVLRKQGYIW